MKLFMEHVKRNETDKVVKMCNKGLDPNFHEHDSGGEYILNPFKLL